VYSVHVVPNHAGDGNWLVEVTGQEDKQAFSTQEEAIRAARQMAIDNKGELFVHNQQGQNRGSFQLRQRPARTRLARLEGVAAAGQGSRINELGPVPPASSADATGSE
jgi:uncharacterized protein DUF2188